MSRRLNLPDTASIANPMEDGRLNAPSAARNSDPIADILRDYAPSTGRALEIASGTGQHAVAFAAVLPGLIWQPTEVDEDRRVSIDAWAADAGLRSLLPAVHLDATTPGWAVEHSGQDLVLLVNLLHLIGGNEARTLIDEVGKVLSPGGRFILYGPFLRGGAATSDGDERFHASLKAQDPEIGYKDDAEVKEWLQLSGLSVVATIDMPANNLAVISERMSEGT